jgi:type I restriction enzyme S subunit
MDAQQFVAEFGYMANAPDGIHQLRLMILVLAMQGKLVGQSPNKKASDLLGQALAAKQRAADNGSIRRPKPLPEVQDGEAPHVIPGNWIWVRFGEVAYHNSGKTLDSGRNNGTPRDYITTSNLYWGRFELTNVRKMLIQDDEMDKCTARKNDLLICEGGEAGRAAVWTANYEVCFQNHIHRARLWGDINPFFVYRFLEKISLTGEINAHRKGIGISNLSSGALAMIPLPLPPLDEQVRIVAKVDELMALCDKLEAQQQARETRKAVLAQALLTRFAEEPTQANLHSLFHSSRAITPADLRKAIISVAFQGKLVLQNPNDAPVIDLVNELRQSERMTSKWGGPITEAEQPDRLPDLWEWVRLGEVCALKHGYAFASEYFTADPAPFVLTTPGNFYENGGFRDRPSKRKYYSGPVDPVFILKPGDLIIPMTEQAAGLLGSPAFIPDDGMVYIHNQRLGKLTFIEFIAPEFAFWFCNSDYFRGELARTCTGMKVRHTSPDRILRVLFPVPPLAEQRKIVLKVDELMALVDKLEVQLSTANTVGKRLVETVVSALTGIATSDEQDLTVKAPPTELIAILRLGRLPDLHQQAPLATELARHQGSMAVRDLWQRFGGDIDAFYAQLKTEVTNGWIQEPTGAEVRTKPLAATDA